MYYADTSDNKPEVSVLISDRIEYRTRSITRNKEGHFLRIEDSIPQEYRIILNIYVLNNHFRICETRNGRPKEINEQIHNYGLRFYFFFPQKLKA